MTAVSQTIITIPAKQARDAFHVPSREPRSTLLCALRGVRSECRHKQTLNADAERILIRLASDADLARRFSEMSEATALSPLAARRPPRAEL